MGPRNRFPTVVESVLSGSVKAPAPWRRPAAIAVGVVGVAVYNWWLPVAVSRRLLTSPDELFSDLEAAGRHDATLLQHLDLAAGLILLVALLLRGPVSRAGGVGSAGAGVSGSGITRRSEWPWLIAFAVSGAVGGRFAYACPEGLSASCRAAEWRLALPHHHYVHVVAGIVEFVTGTVAIYLAWQRTRAGRSAVTRAMRWTGRALVVSYPVLGFAYLTDRLGAFVEPVFFACFSVVVAVELLESDGRLPGPSVRIVPHARRVLQRVLHQA